MKKIHIALSTNNIPDSIADYSQRLGLQPCVVIEGEYALWRTDTVNLSIRCVKDLDQVGQLRHLGFEDSDAREFTQTTDVNGIDWEHFSAAQQAQEIRTTWPKSDYYDE